MDTFLAFLNYFNEENTMELLLLLMVSFVIFVMVRLHFSNSSAFDLEDLVCHNGRLDEKKFTRFGAWVISTWGFIYIMVKNPNSIPEWYFVGYMGVWVTNVIFDRYVDKKKGDGNYHPPRNYDKNDRPPKSDDPEI